MADRDSASESDSSSIDGCPIMMPPSPITREQLQKRIESLQQQNRVLKVELETYKLRVKAMQEENRNLRQASVIIQAKAEQEEEYISNTLLKKIQALKKEKESLAHHYEQEEECLTNDLTRKMLQLRQEKCILEQTLEQEQECYVNKLMRKIEKLEAETLCKQANLEQLRREKVELENTLEQEQEAFVNRLWKRMDKLEAEKRNLQIKLDEPISEPPSPKDIGNGEDTANNISSYIQVLRSEVIRLRNQLQIAQKESTMKVEKFAKEERQIREENVRLQRKLQVEVERRVALCRHLSESESSLEMDDERQSSIEMAAVGAGTTMTSAGASLPIRSLVTSSPSPFYSLQSPSTSRPISPAIGGSSSGSLSRESSLGYCGGGSRCYACGQTIGSGGIHSSFAQSSLMHMPSSLSSSSCSVTNNPSLSLNMHGKPNFQTYKTAEKFAKSNLSVGSGGNSIISGSNTGGGGISSNVPVECPSPPSPAKPSDSDKY